MAARKSALLLSETNIEGVDHGGALPIVPPIPASADGDETTPAQRTFRGLASFLEPTALPANDDREAAGAILEALRSSRKHSPFLVSFAAMAIWLAICGLTYYAVLWQPDKSSILISLPKMLILASAALLAVLFLIVGAARRAQDLQQTTRCLIKVVADLVDPQSDGSAGVIRARARAGAVELESALSGTLSRVEALASRLSSEQLLFEQASSRSERSFRALLDELSSERASVVTNAEKLRGAIAGAHQNLSSDIDGASARLAQSLSAASSNLTEAMRLEGANLVQIVELQQSQIASRLTTAIEDPLKRSVEQISKQGDRFGTILTNRAKDFEEKLSNNIKEALQLIERQSKDFTDRGGLRLEHMTSSLKSLLMRMESAIDDRAATINEMLASRTIDLSQALKDAGTELTSVFDDTSQNTHKFIEAADAATAQLQQQLSKLDGSALAPLGMVASALEEKGRVLSTNLLERFTEIDRMLTTHSNLLLGGLADGGQILKEAISDAGKEVRDAYAGIADESRESLTSQAAKIDRLAAERMAAFESALSQQRFGFVEEIAVKTSLLINAMEGHKQEIERLRSVSLYSKGGTYRPPSLLSQAGNYSELDANIGPKPLFSNSVSSREPKKGNGRESSISTKGWMTDLLQRASDEKVEQPVTAAAPVGEEQSLSFLSKNIRASFKSDLLAQTWDSYRLGKEAFFDKVYTPRGSLQLFQLRNRSKSDKDLLSTIEKYVDEFERLLQDIQGEQPDENIVLNYLASDAGLVYTLLAHSIRKL